MNPNVQPTELIHRTVFISVINPLTPMADIALQVQTEYVRLATSSITGVALGGTDRWICLLEGNFTEVEYLFAAIVNQTRPKALHMLMTDSRATQRMFPHERLSWRQDATFLEKAAFVNDMYRSSRKISLWTIQPAEIMRLLEPAS